MRYRDDDEITAMRLIDQTVGKTNQLATTKLCIQWLPCFRMCFDTLDCRTHFIAKANGDLRRY